MKSVEHHATRADDWRIYGNNMAEESQYVGHFLDARRVMLDAWENWTSGEPGRDEVLYEFLATLWAMAMASGMDGVDIEGPLQAFAASLGAP